MNAGDFTTAIVRVVFFDRDGEACFVCRKPLRWEDRAAAHSGGWSAHHRKPRGNGGTSNPAIGNPSNCLTLCGTGTTGCHGRVEHRRADAIEAGLLISMHGVGEEFDPARARVRRGDGSWWLLTDGGRAVEVEGPGVHAWAGDERTGPETDPWAEWGSR